MKRKLGIIAGLTVGTFCIVDLLISIAGLATDPIMTSGVLAVHAMIAAITAIMVLLPTVKAIRKELRQSVRQSAAKNKEGK